MSIGSGTYTIGAAGDYATIADAMADINFFAPGQHVLSGDLTLVILGNEFDVYASPGLVALAGHTLTIEGSIPNYGNPLVGSSVTAGGADIIWAWQSWLVPLDSGSLIIRNLRIGDAIWGGRFFHGFFGGAMKINTTIENCIFISCNVYSTYHEFQNNGIFKISNNKIFGHLLVGGYCGKVNNPAIIENNTIKGGLAFNGGVFISGGGYITFKNNVAFADIGWGTKGFYFQYVVTPANTMMVGINNASHDASAIGGMWDSTVGCRTGIVPADEFASLLLTDANGLFLKGDIIKENNASASPQRGKAPLRVSFDSDVIFEYGDVGVLARNGTTDIQNTADITGDLRPRQDGEVSIGCHEPTVIEA